MKQNDVGKTPPKIKQLVTKREDLRQKRQFAKADQLRNEIEGQGYSLIDTPYGPRLKHSQPNLFIPRKIGREGIIALFGSGEMSPTGRRIHEFMVKDLQPPIDIALLETPAGFEVNPHLWYRKLKTMLTVGLGNFKPKISLIPALRNTGKKSTNTLDILSPLQDSDYIHAGAGSPTYTIKHLKHSLALTFLRQHIKSGKPLSFASAAAIAMSRYALPVYEIYKVGADPYWHEGLNFFDAWGLNLTIITHWNNDEGGSEIDTSRCFMGKKRFAQLILLLPKGTTVLGIDEHTALIFDPNKKECKVMGVGGVTVITDGVEKQYKRSQIFSFL